MGFREVVLLGSALLVSGGNLCAATQNRFNATGANETRERIPQEQPTAGPEPPRSPHTNGTDPLRPPVSYRLRTYQLRRPAAAARSLQESQSRRRSETSDQLKRGETVRAQELKSLIPGPDLNPPVKQTPEVAAVKLEQRAPAFSVAARCGEGEVTVEVKQRFLGNGQLIRPSDLTLGGCAARHAADQLLHFQTELQGCGSTLTMTEEALVYSFSLVYSPTPVGHTAIVKTNPAEVVVECRYPRRHHVSSGGARPTWTAFASEASTEQPLRFSLRLMTEDWQSQRPSSAYLLSDVLRVEAAVLQGHHIPLRVYVDSCVATVDADPGSRPRHPFINNHGCLNDAKLTGAKSLFMQRSQEDKLQFQLRAFRFHRDHGNSVYITCRMKATPVSVPVDSQHKACSFLAEADRWVASGGDNAVCSCCEAGCDERRRKRRWLADDGGDVQWEATAALGPILLMEEEEEEGTTARKELLPKAAAPLLRRHEGTRAASPSSTALLCGLGAAVTTAAVLLFVTGAVILSGLCRPAAVCA